MEPRQIETYTMPRKTQPADDTIDASVADSIGASVAKVIEEQSAAPNAEHTDEPAARAAGKQTTAPTTTPAKEHYPEPAAKNKKSKKSAAVAFIWILGIAAIVTAAILVYMNVIQPSNRYQDAVRLFGLGQYAQAAATLEGLPESYKDVSELLPYYRAYAAFENKDYRAAAEKFASLGDYGSSATMVDECNYQYAGQLLAGDRFDEAMTIYEELGEYKDSRDKANESRYQLAVSLLTAQGSAQARELFTQLGNYKDSTDKLMDCDYFDAMKLLEEGQYDAAFLAFVNLGTYRDSVDMAKECRYQHGLSLLAEENYDEARKRFAANGDYKDSEDMIRECDYLKATERLNNKEYDAAYGLFAALGGYKDSETMLLEVRYMYGLDLLADGEYEEAMERFKATDGYRDSKDKWNEAAYTLAGVCYEDGDLEKALSLYTALGSYRNSSLLAAQVTKAIEEARAVPYSPPDSAYFSLDWTNPSSPRLTVHKAVLTQWTPPNESGSSSRTGYYVQFTPPADLSFDEYGSSRLYLRKRGANNEVSIFIPTEMSDTFMYSASDTYSGLTFYQLSEPAIPGWSAPLLLSGRNRSVPIVVNIIGTDASTSGAVSLYNSALKTYSIITRFDGIRAGAILLDETVYIDLAYITKPISAPARSDEIDFTDTRIRVESRKTAGTLEEAYKGYDIYLASGSTREVYVNVYSNVYVSVRSNSIEQSKQDMKLLIDNIHK